MAASSITESCSGSTSSSKRTVVLVYGSTSFTGPLVIDYLLQHRDRSRFDVILAGRSTGKLAELVDRLGIEGEVDIAACPLEDTVAGRAKVDEMVARCSVVINLAGPYSTHNARLLVHACASTSKHYVDLTGETPFVRSIIDKYDHLAWVNRSCIVPSCGFDSIPSDSVVWLSGRKIAHELAGLGKASGPVDGVMSSDIVESKTFVQARGSASGGTIASGFALMDMEPEERNAGMGEFALSKGMKGVKSSGPKLVYTDKSLGLFGSIFIMAQVNAATVRRTWYLLQNARPGFFRPTSPHDTSEAISRATPISSMPAQPTFSYGADFTYEESMTMARRGRAAGYLPSAFYSVLVALGGLAFTGSRLFRWLLKKVVLQPGQGPTREQMDKGYADITNISTARGGHQAVTVMSIEGDAGYLVTAQMLVESALALTLDHDNLPDLGQQGGVLTPMSAMGEVLIKRLEQTGRIKYTTSSVDQWRKERAAAGESKKLT